MKLRKNIIDQILELTESKPEELLAWFTAINKYKNHYAPCLALKEDGTPNFYKGVMFQSSNYYDLPHNIDKFKTVYLIIERKMLVVPYVAHGWFYSEWYSIYDLWNYAGKSDKNYNKIIKQYKKMYKIKDKE